MRQGKVKANKMAGIHEWLIDKQSLREYVKEMKSLGADKHNPHRNGGGSPSCHHGQATRQSRLTSPFGLSNRRVSCYLQTSD
jgi:hypothetical protein